MFKQAIYPPVFASIFILFLLGFETIFYSVKDGVFPLLNLEKLIAGLIGVVVFSTPNAVFVFIDWLFRLRLAASLNLCMILIGLAYIAYGVYLDYTLTGPRDHGIEMLYFFMFLFGVAYVFIFWVRWKLSSR